MSLAEDGRYVSIWDIDLPLNDDSNIDDIRENDNIEIIIEENIISSSNSDFSSPIQDPLRIMSPHNCLLMKE